MSSDTLAIARARFARVGPRKVGQILALIRGKTAAKAFDVLRFTPKSAVTIVEKTLRSAVANLGEGVPPEQVVIREIWVNQGPVLKRMRASAMCRGVVYRRKTCHLTVVVARTGAGGGAVASTARLAERNASAVPAGAR